MLRNAFEDLATEATLTDGSQVAALPAGQLAALIPPVPQTDALTDAELRAATLSVKEVRPATGTVTSVGVTTTSTVALAASGARLGALFFNEGPEPVLLALAATSSTAAYSVSVALGSLFEPPAGYTGDVSAVTASSTATLLVTALTA